MEGDPIQAQSVLLDGILGEPLGHSRTLVQLTLPLRGHLVLCHCHPKGHAPFGPCPGTGPVPPLGPKLCTGITRTGGRDAETHPRDLEFQEGPQGAGQALVPNSVLTPGPGPVTAPVPLCPLSSLARPGPAHSPSFLLSKQSPGCRQRQFVPAHSVHVPSLPW